jgi:hypothetical protein
MMELFFLGSSLFFIYYGIKLKNDKERYIKFPIIIGLLTLFFAIFRWLDNVVAELIVAIPLILLGFGNSVWKKIFK